MSGHDPLQVAIGRLAIERGILDKAQALAVLERATRERLSFVDAAQRARVLDSNGVAMLMASALEITNRFPGPGSGALAPGDRLGGHVIESVLGRGAMGAVYLARNAAGARRALKVPLFEGPQDEDARQRFAREMEGLARLKPHRHVVQVHAAGLEGPMPYCALELIDGASLDKVLEAGPLSPARALEIGEQVAIALAHSHASGIVHRDVKPANILVRKEDGSAVLTDFGLAHLADRERLTRTGDMLGTPLYMPPEQADARGPADARSDVYSLGATVYELLTGRPPFSGNSLAELVKNHVLAKVVPPSTRRPELTKDVDAVVLKALEKFPGDRYATALAFAEDLARARKGEPVTARSVSGPGRFARAVRRHPGRAALVASVVISVGALGVTFVVKEQLRLAAQQRHMDALEAWRKDLDSLYAKAQGAHHAANEACLGLKPARDSEGPLRGAVDKWLGVLNAPPTTEDRERALSESKTTRAFANDAPLECEVLGALGALEVGRLDGARKSAEILSAGEPDDGHVALEAVLAVLRVALTLPPTEREGLLDKLGKSHSCARCSVSDSGGDPIALAKALSAYWKPTTSERRAIDAVRARAYGSLERAAFDGALDDAARFFCELASDPQALRLAAPAFVAAVCSGSHSSTAAFAERLDGTTRAGLASALAAVDRADPDALGRLPLPEDMADFFLTVGDAVVQKDVDAAERAFSCAIRASARSLADPRIATFRSVLKEEIAACLSTKRDWERAVDMVLDGVRVGWSVTWPSDREADLVKELEARLSAADREGRPRDWALELDLAERLETELDAQRNVPPHPVVTEGERALAGRGVELAHRVAEDPRASRVARSLAHHAAGLSLHLIYKEAEAEREFEAAHDDSDRPSEESALASLCSLCAWEMALRVEGGPRDRHWLDLALQWSEKAVSEWREQREFGLERRPLAGKETPCRIYEEGDIKTSAEAVRAQALLADGKVPEAESALADARPISPEERLQVDAWRISVAVAAGRDAATRDLVARFLGDYGKDGPDALRTAASKLDVMGLPEVGKRLRDALEGARPR
jgi:hypothetical protein